MLTISSTVRRTQTPDGTVLLDVERGQMFCLNPVASQIVEMIVSGASESDIAQKLATSFGQDINTVRTDVCEFIENLRRHHVICLRSIDGT